MNVGARYGLLLAAVYLVFFIALPRPYGLVAWFALIGAQSLAGGWVAWSRARMPFVALSGMLGAVGLTLLAVWVLREGHLFLSSRWLWSGLLVTGAALLVFGIESRFNREKWERWGESMESATVRDIVLMRHIPRVR